MSVLDIRNLSVCFSGDEGDSEIVRDISLYVNKGEIVGLVGESGSGKSTAMLAVMGLLGKDGNVKYREISISGGKPVPGVNVAMIFQDSLSCLNPSVKIGRQICETIRKREKCGRREAGKKAQELLELVGIRKPLLRMKQYPFELSGGMRQRVVIAVALACRPDLIIADEPTTALDAVVQAQILLLLKRLVKETGTSLLLVSHDMGVTAAVCKRVYVMSGGRIIESGDAEDIFYSPAEEYTRKLLRDSRGRILNRSSAVSGDPLLSMRHVTRRFDGGEGVTDVSLDIRKGEIFALVGESGSGKTTAAKILTGMLGEDSGSMAFDGQPMESRKRLNSFNGRVQMVFQDPYAALNPGLTVHRMLEEALNGMEKGFSRKMDAQEKEERIRRILTLTGLSESDAGRYPESFSGGQRQRIGIARALIVEPDLLVCDEALSALDATTREQILELIFRIQRKIGFACLFISHDIQVVRRISDRVGVMYRGHIVETGRTADICSDPWHPYTKQLIESVPEPDPVKASKIRTGMIKEEEKVRPGGCPFSFRCGYALECCTEETPGDYKFEKRTISCFLYSEKHSGKRAHDYKMSSQI